MSFVLKMAWRDSRSSRRRLAFSALSIVFGVAALVGIGSLADNVRRGMEGQVKGLLGADLNLSSRAPLGAEFKTLSAQRGYQVSEEVQFNSMAIFSTKDGATRLVQVRGLDSAYPLYGEFTSEPTKAAAELQQRGRAIIEESLQAQYGLVVGDSIRLGKAEFRVSGILRKVPGETAAMSLFTPRILIAAADVASTQLIQAGSLLRYETHVKLSGDRNPAEEKKLLLERFATLGLRVETLEDRMRNFGNAIRNVDAFLSLVGFVALILGAVGVASAVLVHVRQKLSTVAVLRCLGCSVRQAFSVYVIQGLAVGAVGAVLGAMLGVGIHYLVLKSAGDLLPVQTSWALSWAALGKGLGAGLGISLLFSLHPLLQVRRVSPLLALRSEFSPPPPKVDWLRVGLGVLISLSVLGFAILQAGQLWLGVGFAVALGVGLAVLAGTARLVAWAARRFCPKNLPYAVRQGVANMHRPQNMTVLLLLALGLGTFLVVTIDLSRATQLKGLATQFDKGRSNLLFFGIQDQEQLTGVEGALSKAGARDIRSVPVVTMTLSSVKGKSLEDLLKENKKGRQNALLSREYRVSYRAALGPSEKLLSGTWVDRVTPGTDPVPVSLEKSMADELKLKVGDRLEFDVQGVPLAAEVRSLRLVDWRRLDANFFVLFPEGVLESAPHFYMVGVHAANAADSSRLQRLVVGLHPNVSAIDFGLVMSTLETITGKVDMVVRVVALFTGATGLLVLTGAMLAGRHHRLREVVLLRTLGADRKTLVRLQLVEYAILGFLASTIGCALAAIGNQVLASFVFEARAAWPATTLVGSVLAVTGLTVLIGWFSNRDLLREAPLVVLRRET